MSTVSFKGFRCLKCGQCCQGKGTVRISGGELQTICRYLDISYREALQYYFYKDKGGFILFDQPNRDCIFLRQSVCLIHQVKPRQCYGFPVLWSDPEMLQKCHGFKELNRKKAIISK